MLSASKKASVSSIPRSPSRTPQRRVGTAATLSCGRATLTRILWIHQRLGQGRRLNAVALARELEVSPRTIKRDIETLRVELGARIIWEPSTQTYFYESPCEHLPLFRLHADEALALVLAGETFSAWRGSPLGRALGTALGKVARVVGDAVSLPSSEIDAVLFQPPESPAVQAEHRHFAPLIEAIRRQRELRLTYRKPGAQRASGRLVHPLHLAFLDHSWLLLAHDCQRDALRSFLLARIEGLSPTARRFERPSGFDAKRYFAGNFGRFTGDAVHEVRIVFDAFAAPFIRESPRHPSQQIAARPDGSIEVSLRVNHLTDVQRWILGWGSHAEVLAPAALRATLASEAAALQARYAAAPAVNRDSSLDLPT